MIGLIVKQISDTYTVFCDNKLFDCKARGKFRNLKVSPLVGDNVEFDIDKKIITDIKPRKNVLERPTVSNIDQVFIVISAKEPDFSTTLLDKLLAIIEFNNIKPIICITKVDILSKDEMREILEYKKYYEKIGYKVYLNSDLATIKKQLAGKLTVLTGQSGAGKSTLLNNIDPSLKLKVGPISMALGRGKHTTRHTELIRYADGWIADTPGFSAISLKDMSGADIRDNFIEFNSYRDNCEYRDCMHISEENCAVKKAINDGEILLSRYNNYLSFIKER